MGGQMLLKQASQATRVGGTSWLALFCCLHQGSAYLCCGALPFKLAEQQAPSPKAHSAGHQLSLPQPRRGLETQLPPWTGRNRPFAAADKTPTKAPEEHVLPIPSSQLSPSPLSTSHNYIQHFKKKNHTRLARLHYYLFQGMLSPTVFNVSPPFTTIRIEMTLCISGMCLFILE